MMMLFIYIYTKLEVMLIILFIYIYIYIYIYTKLEVMLMTVHIYNIYKAGGEKYIHKAGKWADAGSKDEEQPGVRKKMREPVAFVFCSWSCSCQCIG